MAVIGEQVPIPVASGQINSQCGLEEGRALFPICVAGLPGAPLRWGLVSTAAQMPSP